MNTQVEDTQDNVESLNLDVDVKETSACGRHVTVTVPRNDVERYFSKQFDELVPKAEVPGFRPGKAPRKLVEKKFRKQLVDQVKGQLIMDSLAQVNESQEFSAISEPDLDYEQVKLPEEGDFKYEFNIEVRPEFEVPEYKGLTLKRPEHDFTDADIDKEIQKIARRESKATLAPVEGAAQAGDVVICKITCRDENEEVVEVSDEVRLEVVETVDFADTKVEEFDKVIVGASAGDTRTASAEISEFADNEALRGKTVNLEFEVLDIKRMEQVETDEVVSMLELESADRLREILRESLTRRLEYSQRETIRDQISEALTEAADWNLPPDLLERQASRELKRTVMEMQSSGFSETDIVARENQLRKDAHNRTARLLKEHFILERIAEMEEIEDAPQDYELEIAKLAIHHNDSPRRVRTRLERTGQMDALRNMIIERKVIELITDNATFEATKFVADLDDSVYSSATFLAGKKQHIPEAKYEGGDGPAIPGTDKDS